ncbi:PREDICTED: prolyl-tRNA synthetase associated domain-containing protein 1-like [Gavialis gangeticus]|uniref:prolyl-tRNA synthetase associated domain-containing protein 1-like n=1 Tax=Gavialis gangeticus TaxID=94835 RepID=UPI00092FD28E|nr:PREDICTED: prolyl-tRNA synthetase associated domain-containing protein 1-like [Gavialis gangeticus]
MEARGQQAATGAGLRGELEARLRTLGISPLCVEHPEVFTVEELMQHVGHLGGGHSKNLFLRDKKKKGLWLVTALHDRQVNLNDLGKKLGLGSGTLRFADEKAMQEKLKVGQGCTTPLALFCDTGGGVRLVLDAGFLDGGYDRVYFHPMTNAATMGLTPEDFLRFVKSTGHDPLLIHFEDNAM